MGWWGVNVMEGDPPMDAECDIEDILKKMYDEKFPNDPLSLNKEDLDEDEDEPDSSDLFKFMLSKRGTVMEVIRRIKAEGMDYDGIILQVLGEIIMCWGFNFPKKARASCRRGARIDEWAFEDDERKNAMNLFIKRVNTYVNGVALEPASMGLFAKIQEHVDAGKEGLVNR